MKGAIDPGKRFYKKHLKKYAQYSIAEDWLSWCTNIAFLRGMRAVYFLQDYINLDAKVLDLGCGIGLTLGTVSQYYPNSYGCDIGKSEVAATKEMLRKVKTKSKIELYDGKRLPYQNNFFDAILNLEVIEHAQNPEIMLAEASRVLNKDGVLIITTANKWWPHEPHYKLLFLSYLPDKLADYYLKFSGKGETYSDIKLPSYSEFKIQVEKYFTVEDITLSIIKNYEKYELGKERGKKIIIAASLLRFIDQLDSLNVPYIKAATEYLFARISLGWVFVARKKNEKR